MVNKTAPFSPLGQSKDDDSIEFSITPKSKRKLSLLRKSVSLKHLSVPERFTKSVNNLNFAVQPSSDTSNRIGATSLDATDHNKMMKKKELARRKSNPKSLHVVKVKGGHVELHSSASCFQNSDSSIVQEDDNDDSSKQPPRKPKRQSSRGGAGLRRTSSRREGRRDGSARRGSNSNNLKAQLAMNGSIKSRGKARSKSKSRRTKEDKKMDGSNTSTMASSVRRMQDSSSNPTSSIRRNNTVGDNCGSNLLSPKRRAKSQDAKSSKAKMMLSMNESSSSLESKSNTKRRSRSHSRARKPGSDHSNTAKKRVHSASRSRTTGTAKKPLDAAGSDHSTSNSGYGRGALRRARSVKNLEFDGNRSASFSSGSSRSLHHSFSEHAGASSSGTNRRASRLALARAANHLAQNKQVQGGGRNDTKKTLTQGESGAKRASLPNESKKTQVQSETKKTQVQSESNKKTQPQQGDSQGIDGSNKENTSKQSGVLRRPNNFRRAKSQSSLSVSSQSRSEMSIDEVTPSTPVSTSTPGSQPPSTRRFRGGRPSLKKSMSQSALMVARTNKHHALDTLLELEPAQPGGSNDDEDTSIVSTMTSYSAIERAVQDAVQEAISDALSQHTQNISNAAATNLIQRLQSGLVTS